MPSQKGQSIVPVWCTLDPVLVAEVHASLYIPSESGIVTTSSLFVVFDLWSEACGTSIVLAMQSSEFAGASVAIGKS
jgi:hypothetical protein